MYSLHPASFLFLWAVLVVAMQQLPLPLRIVISVILALLLWRLDRHRLLNAIKRIRWLMLTTVVLFVWATPGEFLSWMPGATYEGLQQALTHGASLLMFVLMLAVLLRCLQVGAMVSALHTLLYPLTWFGLNRDRAAVRLLLTLQTLETAERTSGKDGWRALLSPASMQVEPVSLGLAKPAIGAADFVAAVAGLSLAMATLTMGTS